MTKLKAVYDLARPFTLLAPALGIVAFGFASLGFGGDLRLDAAGLLRIAAGAAMAAILNIASNAVNQVCDLEIDRVNKPERPLPAGRLTVGEANVVTWVSYALALAIAATLGMTMLAIVTFTAFLTYAYSGPPFRTKRHWLLANLTIAAPRGFLLPVAGWVAPRPELTLGTLPLDLWIVAGASGVFILGAATTKDFADMEGDKKGGCITMPLRFGVEPAARVVAPFLFAPWIALAVCAGTHVLTGNTFVLFWGSVLCALLGLRAAWLLVRDPAALTQKSTHPAWVLMYLLMLATQAVAGLGYALPPALWAGAAP